MGWWWSKKVDKASVIETLHQAAQLVEKYQNYEFGICNLMPNQVKEKIQSASKAVKQLNECTVFYEDMEKAYVALTVLNNMKTAKDPEMAAKAYGQLLQSFGTVLSKLPSPASAYARPLTEIGAKFERIVGTLMPSAHGSGLDNDLKDFLAGGQKFINGI
jgi:predicted sugar kinase